MFSFIVKKSFNIQGRVLFWWKSRWLNSLCGCLLWLTENGTEFWVYGGDDVVVVSESELCGMRFGAYNKGLQKIYMCRRRGRGEMETRRKYKRVMSYFTIGISVHTPSRVIMWVVHGHPQWTVVSGKSAPQRAGPQVNIYVNIWSWGAAVAGDRHRMSLLCKPVRLHSNRERITDRAKRPFWSFRAAGQKERRKSGLFCSRESFLF